MRPLPEYINRIARYMPYRSKSVKNLQEQLFLSKKITPDSITSPLSVKPNDTKSEHNIILCLMMRAIERNDMLPTSDTNRGLINPFSKKQATSVQTNDLLNFRCIGQREFLLRVSVDMLKQPSVRVPNRRRRLQTFSDKKVNKSRVTKLEKDIN